MTLIATQTRTQVVYIYSLLAPDTGTNNINITFSGASIYVCIALNYYGVGQTTPINTIAQEDTGTSTTTDIDAVSADGDLVVGFALCTSGGTLSPNGGETERADLIQGASSFQAQDERATTTPTNMAWLCSDTGVWVDIAFAMTAATAVAPLPITKTISTAPRGTYRVLARVRNDVGFNLKIGVGYSYGGVTKDPSVASDYADVATSQTAWHILDIGSIVIPASDLPDGSSIGTFTVRVLFYDATADGGASFDMDWLLLLPADMGVAYATKTAATEQVVMDTISELPALSLWDTSDVFRSFPEQAGAMIRVHPEGTRVYMIDDDGSDAAITEGWKVKVKVIPQYLHIG